jgi:hypothetical protein
MDLTFGESVLVESRYKIARAKEHDRVLYAEIRKFLNANPYTLIKEYDREQSRYLLKLKIDEPMPQGRWGLIIGDCVHNLRSALDYIAWRLARSLASDRITLFPIYDTQAEFEEMASRRRLDLRIHPDAVAAIRDVQPYKRAKPKDDLLWFLQELDARDKHKLINMTQTQAAGGFVGAPASEQIKVAYGGMDDGAIVAEIKFPSGTPQSEMKVKIKPRFDIAFERGILSPDGLEGGFPVNTYIPQIINRVIKVTLEFERLITANPHWIR